MDWPLGLMVKAPDSYLVVSSGDCEFESHSGRIFAPENPY